MQRTAIAVAIALGTAGLTQGLTAESAFAGGRADSELVVYVSGQGLYYDSVLAAKRLPQKGRFQKLEMGGPHGGIVAPCLFARCDNDPIEKIPKEILPTFLTARDSMWSGGPRDPKYLGHA